MRAVKLPRPARRQPGRIATAGQPDPRLPRRVVVPLVVWPVVAVIGGVFRLDVLHFMGDTLRYPVLVYVVMAGGPVVCAVVWVVSRYLPTRLARLRSALWFVALVSTLPLFAAGGGGDSRGRFNAAVLEVMAVEQRDALLAGRFAAVLTGVAVGFTVFVVFAVDREGAKGVLVSLAVPIVALAGFAVGGTGIDRDRDSVIAGLENGLRKAPQVALPPDVQVSGFKRVGCLTASDLRRCRGSLEFTLTRSGGAPVVYTAAEYPSRADATDATPRVRASLPAGHGAVTAGHVVLSFPATADPQTTRNLVLGLVLIQMGQHR